MSVKISNINSSTNWISGNINEYKFEAKHFDYGSEFGIDKGRTSKLRIEKAGKCLVSYDRGWDIEPKTVEQIEVCNEVVSYLEALPIRFESECKL